MISFLHQTAQSIIDSIEWSQLRHTTFVLPSHRAGIVLKDELLRLQAAQHSSAVWAPQVLTLTQLQDSLSPLYAEDELMTIVRLYRHYCALVTDDRMSLDMFYGWGRQMLADFTNVDASMPAEEVPNFFANTIAAHELEQWHFDKDVEERLRGLLAGSSSEKSRAAIEGSVKRKYELLWQQIYELYQGLRAEMQSEQKGYPGLRQRAVIEAWESDQIQKKIAGRTYIFVGFNYLLPVEFELMKRLSASNPNTQFYWDFVPQFRTNSKAFSFAEKNAELLGNAMPEQESRVSSPITLISCISREAQAQYVHQWLIDNYRENGQKVGVIICDETMLEPVIYALPAITLPGQSEPTPINITKGFPLRNTQVFADTMKWLSDPSLGPADTLVTPDIIDRLLAALCPAKENVSPESVDKGTAGLSWQELLILESQYQVRKIANQMRVLISAGLDGIPFTLKLLRLLMRRMMEGVTMPFHGEPVTDVQVMGVLETRLLDFDKLLLINVEEGVLPQKQADISFIPYYLRKTYHMQTPDERASVYAYNFFRLLSRAGETSILFTSAETAEGGKGASRFILQLLASPDFEVTKYRLEEKAVLSPMDDMMDAMPLMSWASTKPQRLSPSALNTFITCRRSFYLQYILGLQAREEEEVLFKANTLGSFVHHVMEYIYTTYLDCKPENLPRRISSDEIDTIRTDEARLQAALKAAYVEMNNDYNAHLPHPKDEPEEHYIMEQHVAENVIILGYVRNILDRDYEDAKVGLQIVLLEKKRYFALPIEDGTLQIGGIIDRLDLYGPECKEVMRVVDYKSGSYNDTTHAKKMSSTWEELMSSPDKGYVRQTLLYSHAVLTEEQPKQPIEPNLYFCQRKVTDIETTLEVEHQTVSDYAAIQEPFISHLTEKIEEMLSTTDFHPCEPDECPSYCPFFELCGRKPQEY